jgi:hypothetical protein
MNKNEIFVQGVVAGVILSAFVGVAVSFIIRGWRAWRRKPKRDLGGAHSDENERLNPKRW